VAARLDSSTLETTIKSRRGPPFSLSNRAAMDCQFPLVQGSAKPLTDNVREFNCEVRLRVDVVEKVEN
jgi:hypothetical protein